MGPGAVCNGNVGISNEGIGQQFGTDLAEIIKALREDNYRRLAIFNRSFHNQYRLRIVGPERNCFFAGRKNHPQYEYYQSEELYHLNYKLIFK
jgi:hypothetical protein